MSVTLRRVAPPIVMLVAAACATTPREPPRPLAPLELARIDHIEGRPEVAWKRWLTLASSRGDAAPAAARALLAEVDAAALDAEALATARQAMHTTGGAYAAEVAEQIAARAGDGDALREARQRLGAVYTARATGRLRAWPFLASRAFDAVVVPDAAWGPAEAIRAGWLASPDEGPGLYAFRVEPEAGRAGPFTIEVRAEGACEIRVGGRRAHHHPRLSELLPEVARVPITLDPGEPVDVLVVAREGRARARVFLRPGHAPAPAIRTDGDPARALAALDLALADGDVAGATTALVDLERLAGPERAALVEDARRRLARADATRPPELREATSDDEPERGAAPATSCAARARIIDAEPERLRHRPDRVAALAEATPALIGPCADVALRLGALLVETHQLDAARALVERLTRELDPGPEVDAARRLEVRVDAPRGATLPPPAGSATPWSHPWSRIGPPLADGRALAASAPDPLPPGRLVVHDDWHAYVDHAGRVTLRSHVVACAGDAATTEALGEIALPDDAELVLARTWIRSRRGTPTAPLALEPEDIVEKASVSLPALVPGDCAEWAWFRELAPDPRLPEGAFTTPRLALERADATVVRARVTLEVEPGVEPIVVIAPSASAISAASRPNPTTWVWEARDLAPRVPEPLDPEPEARRLHVRVWGAGAGAGRDAWVEALAAEVELGLRASPAIEELARAAIGESTRARLEALYGAVVARVERFSEGPLANASWAVHRARGERAVVLAAACIAAGMPCDLVVARPLSEGPDGPVPDPDAYAYPLVRARLGPDPVWLDPTNAHMPFGLVPPLVQGVPARVLGGARDPDPAAAPAAPTAITTPRLAGTLPGQGERKVDITIRVATDGRSAIATGAETLDGIYGATWREALSTMAPEARRRLLTVIVEQALPGATIIDLTPGALDQGGATPYIWSWRAHVPIESAGGVSRALRVALLPESLARGTIQLPERTTPLFVNRAADLALRVTVTLPDACTTGPRRAPCDWVFVSAPPPHVRVAAPTLLNERRVTIAQRTLTIDKTLRLAPALIAPEDYTTWKDAALASDRADYLQLVFGPLPRETSPP